MTTFKKISTLVLGGTILTLAACSTATPASSAKQPKANMQSKQQMMDGEHKAMMQQMETDHEKMSKMDMSKMDMSKLSPECKAMKKKMKEKMADKHKDGDMKSHMKDHDMSKMGEHDMMKKHDAEKMKAKMATHKKCMAEMKEAMPHSH